MKPHLLLALFLNPALHAEFNDDIPRITRITVDVLSRGIDDPVIGGVVDNRLVANTFFTGLNAHVLDGNAILYERDLIVGTAASPGGILDPNNIIEIPSKDWLRLHFYLENGIGDRPFNVLYLGHPRADYPGIFIIRGEEGDELTLLMYYQSGFEQDYPFTFNLLFQPDTGLPRTTQESFVTLGFIGQPEQQIPEPSATWLLFGLLGTRRMRK